MPKQFRINAKRFFLTYPQCDTEKGEALKRLLEKEDVDWVVIAQEKHKDGSNHLHVILETSKKKNVTRQDYFDYVTGTHGNYQSVKNFHKCLEYVTKDGDFIQHGINVDAKLKSMKSKSSYGFEVCAQELQQGMSVYDIAKRNPGFVLQNRIKLIGFQNWWRMESFAEPDRIWAPVKVHADNLSMFAVHSIVDWINENVKKPRGFKQKQLYIHGKANVGKTSLITFLGNALKIYIFPQHDRWCDGYEDGKFDLAVFDEFKSDRRLAWMNRWLEGSPFAVEVKNSFVMKRQNIPTIILSNYSPEECYHKAAGQNTLAFAAFKSRLRVVEVDRWMQLDWTDEADVGFPSGLSDISNSSTLSLSPASPVGKNPGLHMDIGKPLPKLDDILAQVYSDCRQAKGRAFAESEML